ncbi:MAG TPA: thioredoxin domain-containing protein [Solirubrobacterales bacterium]|nr:thioredoxin domain-containing protein [Candidatus Limnocylindrales bacterium]HEU4599424.1 thioredoxin domain-containing protein [Solirubrobacterales bacterium]HEU4803969.1 thioredoxin domain-containing protein [Solirubrobacterales bacterium]
MAAIGLLAAIVSLSVGEHREEKFTISGSGEVQELVGGIPQLGDRLGSDDAPITIDVFNDIQCTRCADYQREVIDPLINDYVRPGDAQMIFRHYPLGGKPVTLGGVAAEAAGQQDRQWQFIEVFIRNLDQVPAEGVTQEFLNEIASATPKLEVTDWEQAMQGDEAEQAATAGNDLGTKLKITANPAVVVTGANGSEELDDAPGIDDIEAAIDSVS